MSNSKQQSKHTPRPPSPTPQRREIFAWVMYDWANSAYSTLLITIVMHYIQEIVLPGDAGPVAFAWGIGGGMIIAAVLSPIVGAAADANQNKRRWLAGTAFCGAAAAVAMAMMPPGMPWAIIAFFVLMGVCFELSLVPYNGFLLEITDEQTINRVSAWGYALGYAGGSVPLIASALLFKYGNTFGVTDQTTLHRLCILMLGLWWGLFSLPTILFLRDRGVRPDRKEPFLRAARSAVSQVSRTLSNIRRFPVLALFLLAFLIYNDGIQTVITQATTVANKALHFSMEEMFMLVLMIQLVALPGALLMGWLADKLGQKQVLLGCLIVWSGLLVTAAVVNDKTSFWIMGFFLALVMGGTQSVSRALMGNITPPQHAAEFFGFFNLSGKAASMLGPIQFGLIILITGNARFAAVSLLIFFILGGLLLMKINVAEGRRQAMGEGTEERGE